MSGILFPEIPPASFAVSCAIRPDSIPHWADLDITYCVISDPKVITGCVINPSGLMRNRHSTQRGLKVAADVTLNPEGREVPSRSYIGFHIGSDHGKVFSGK